MRILLILLGLSLFCGQALAQSAVPVTGLGGGGGAVTAASGSYVDGAIVTLGTKADTAWSGTGAGSEIAILKSIANDLSGSLTITGTIGLSVGGTPISASNPLPSVLESTQQTSTDTAVTVAASTSTVVWTTASTARFLSVVPNNQSCFMRQDGGTASATSIPIPGGWNWNLSEPPPNTNVTVFCTTAANVAVHQGT